VSSISNPASPGAPSQVVAEQPIRAPLLGNIPWAGHDAHPAVVAHTDRAGYPPRDTHVRPVPASVVDAAGGPMNRAK
jgi:hypothetical protein